MLFRLVAPLVSVAVVAAAVLVVLHFFGHSSGKEPGPGVVTAASPPLTPRTTSTASTGPSASAVPTAAPTSSAKPTPKPTHSAPAPKKHRPPTAMASVRVYNSTRITGLAHHVAAEIQARGWTVTDVGNVSGASTRTTVYYAPGDKPAAQHLAAEFSGIRDVEPDRAAGISFSGLTVILTADWHD